MKRTSLFFKVQVLLLMAATCFQLDSLGQNTITNIPTGWKVNGQEVRNGQVTGIADQSEVVLTPSETDLRRVKAIRVETLSPWRGMEFELSKASENHIGWVIAKNGKVYPHMMAAKSDKTTPVATIAYVGSGVDAGHGLAIALEDVSHGRFTWKEAQDALNQWASINSVSGTTWRLPTISDLNKMNGKDNRLFSLANESGVQPVQHDFYWTSDQNEQSLGAFFLFNNNFIQFGNKTLSYYVRAVLEF